MVLVLAEMGEYIEYQEGEEKKYELNVIYWAMSYFELINNF